MPVRIALRTQLIAVHYKDSWRFCTVADCVILSEAVLWLHVQIALMLLFPGVRAQKIFVDMLWDSFNIHCSGKYT